MNKGRSLGQVGYEAYGEFTEWKTYSGAPMPAWDDLPWRIQTAWHTAAGAVREARTLITRRDAEIAYVITGGSAGYQYDHDKKQSRFWDISGLEITEDEYGRVSDALREAMYYA